MRGYLNLTERIVILTSRKGHSIHRLSGQIEGTCRFGKRTILSIKVKQQQRHYIDTWARLRTAALNTTEECHYGKTLSSRKLNQAERSISKEIPTSYSFQARQLWAVTQGKSETIRSSKAGSDETCWLSHNKDSGLPFMPQMNHSFPGLLKWWLKVWPTHFVPWCCWYLSLLLKSYTAEPYSFK